MATELSIKSNSFPNLPPPPALSPRCEDCNRKESCMCDEMIEENEELAELRRSFCEKCHQEAKMQGGLCACCYYDAHEEDFEDEEEFPICSDCKSDKGTMNGMCPDCYWEDDYRQKYERRNNPSWVFNRSFSTFVVLLNKPKEEAYILAKQHTKDMFGESASEFLKSLEEIENQNKNNPKIEIHQP